MIMLSKPLKGLYIAIVTNRKIATPLVLSLIRWGKDGAEINVISGPLLDHCRNLAVRQFLKTKNKYFLFIDDDTIPNVKDLKKLMKHKKDIIGGVYNCLLSRPNGTIITRPSAYTLIPDRMTLVDSVAVAFNTGLQSVVGMGTGYMMVKREVFEKIPEPWFDFKWADNKHTAFLGEDIGFCMKASEQGIEMWCDTDCTATHSKEVLL